jgi:DNA-binding MarR family transcriptional regulator
VNILCKNDTEVNQVKLRPATAGAGSVHKSGLITANLYCLLIKTLLLEIKMAIMVKYVKQDSIEYLQPLIIYHSDRICKKRIITRLKNMEYFYAEDPYLRMYQLYRRAGAAMHRARRKELRRYRVSDSETAVLFCVHASNNMITPAGIAQQMVQDNHATSQLIVRMEKRGLLKKIKDLPRPNMVRIALTEDGEQMFRKTEKSEHIKSIRSIFSVLSEEERERLSAYLQKLWSKAAEIE